MEGGAIHHSLFFNHFFVQGKMVAMYGHNRHHPMPHRLLGWAVFLTLSFAIIEAIGGYFAHSLALLGDAGHVASDALILGVTAFASWIALRPPSHRHSYGFGRVEVIATWISSLLLFMISIALIIEAIERIHQPVDVHSIPVMVIATFGILLNLLIAKFLSHTERSLTVRVALLHVISDIIGTCVTLLSGIIIFFSQYAVIDPLLSISIGVLIAFSSSQLLWESMTVLMEAVPAHLSIKQVSHTITHSKGVTSIHDVHIWTLSSGVVALSAHITIKNPAVWDELLLELKSILKHQYHIDHITLQPEVNIEECNPCYK
ncbi:Cadmium,cobalt and zinc/H(+)-K(+) antiporter [Coxiella endosymbiont of Amblyomma nuttalli]|nr:Cadmium,cobalt and zinc/H(+)-K(+) antiporter [Coxiella endosymbiont of Amblyomma nuttalli]